VRRPRLNAFFALILLLSAFPALPAAYSHHPRIASQVRHTPRATASDVVSVPDHIRGITTAAAATAIGLSGVAAAFLQRVCGAQICGHAMSVCRVVWVSAVVSPRRPARGFWRPRLGQVVA
jgi:hypothetical protein